MVQEFRPTEVKESTAEKIKHAAAVFCHSLQDVRLRLVFVLLLAVFIALGIPYIVLKIRRINDGEKDETCSLEHELRINCLPDLPLGRQSKEVCKTAGCCWEEFGYSVPSCFYPNPNKYSYEVKSSEEHSTGLKLQISPSFNETPRGREVEEVVNVSAEYWSSNHLRILLSANNNFNPLEHLEYQKLQPLNETDKKYAVSLERNGKKRIFCINVTRCSPQREIFNTAYGPLIISKGLTEITTWLPSFYLYGIGQNPKNSFQHDLKFYKRHSLFSRMNYDNTSPDTFSLSAGVHPFYLVMEKGGFSHGVLLVSTLPVEIIVSGSPSVTFRTGDTRLDFHIFLGPTPADVIRQLTEFVGRPAMPPYWALGYHSCREAEDLELANRYIKYTRTQRIPHESDCGNAEAINSVSDEDSRASLNYFMEKLKQSGRKLIMFQRPHVPASNGTQGEESIFLRNSIGGDIYEGYLPNKTRVRYLDYFNTKNLSNWLTDEFRNLSNTVEGLFLDKNTPLNFNVSDSLNCSCCQMNGIDRLLQITDDVVQGTVCMGAIHSNEQPHVYYHNIYGHTNMMKVSEILRKILNRRIFLTSLSTFTGSGVYGGHWGGQVESTWSALKQTITQSLDFSLFGIPLTGLPVCGSHGDFDQDLCSKWIQVAAFQPLMFSYRLDGVEPLMKLTSVGRRAIQLRYSFLPYLYSLFHNATKLGDTVVRPLMFEFPKDTKTYGIDEQFLWGSGLMISPNLKSLRKIKLYFPAGCWYDFYKGENQAESSEGSYRDLTTIKNNVILHVRGGHVIPTQPSELSIAKSRERFYIITIALNCLPRNNFKARYIPDYKVLAYGELFIDDDGYSMTSPTNSLLVTVTVTGRNVSIESYPNGVVFQPETIASDVRIYGIPEKPSNVQVRSKDSEHNITHVYNVRLETLMIRNLSLNLRYNHTIWWN